MNMSLNNKPFLRFQAHLAFTQGLPSNQKCQKSLQAHHALSADTDKTKNIAKMKHKWLILKEAQCLTQYKTVGVQWFARVWFPIQFFPRLIRTQPESPTFHSVPRSRTLAINRLGVKFPLSTRLHNRCVQKL
jgi:hypothetical protein